MLAICPDSHTSSSPSSSRLRPAFAQTWQIDTAHSRAQFACATSRQIEHPRRLRRPRPTRTVDYDGKDVTKVEVSATIDVNSVTNPRRQARRAHQDRRLPLRDQSPDDDVRVDGHHAEGSVGRYNMTGYLTIWLYDEAGDVRVDVPSAVLVRRERAGETRVGASATGRINRKDFGVKYHEVMDNGGLGVADEVFIQLDVELIQRAPRTSSNSTRRPRSEARQVAARTSGPADRHRSDTGCTSRAPVRAVRQCSSVMQSVWSQPKCFHAMADHLLTLNGTRCNRQ